MAFEMKQVRFKIGAGDSQGPLPPVANPVEVGLGTPLFLLAGPCVIESLDGCVEIAERLVKICAAVGVPVVFKASFDKANRSSISSFRGPGLKEGLKILARVRDCLLYTSPSPRDLSTSRMPSSA